MNPAEPMNAIPLQVLIEQHLDGIPLFKRDPNLADTEPRNSNRRVLRTIFQPMVVYLLDQGRVPLQGMTTPKSVIEAILARSEMQLPEDLVGRLRQRYGSPEIDWLEEAVKIPMEGDAHPLDKLAQLVIGKMSPQAREVLAKIEFSNTP